VKVDVRVPRQGEKERGTLLRDAVYSPPHLSSDAVPRCRGYRGKMRRVPGPLSIPRAGERPRAHTEGAASPSALTCAAGRQHLVPRGSGGGARSSRVARQRRRHRVPSQAAASDDKVEFVRDRDATKTKGGVSRISHRAEAKWIGAAQHAAVKKMRHCRAATRWKR
jgi:hypothetical protein